MSTIHFSSGGGTETFYVNGNDKYSVSCDANWCYIESYDYTNGIFTIEVSENTSTSSRHTTISINGENCYSSISVSQDGNNGGGGNGGGNSTFSVYPTSLSFSYSSESKSCTITTNGSWSTNCTSSWCHLSSTSGYGNSNLTIRVDENTSTSSRSANLYVYANNDSRYISITQSGSNNGGGGGGIQAPSAPTSVTAENYGSTMLPSIRISWNDVSNATEYIVYRSKTANGSYYELSKTSSTFCYDSNPNTGNNYYKVKAKNSAGTSNYSDYALYNYNPNDVSPCPPQFGNCTATSTSITLRWSISTSTGCGKPDEITLKVYDPDYDVWIEKQHRSGTATSATFYYGMFIDDEGWVKCGIILENSHGSDSGVKFYNTKTGQWF